MRPVPPARLHLPFICAASLLGPFVAVPVAAGEADADAADAWTVVWERDIGIGYAPPTPYGDGDVIAIGTRLGDGEDRDEVRAFLVDSGEVRASNAVPVAPAAGKVARFPGVRAQPVPIAAADGARLLLCSHDGMLRCLDLESWEQVWERDLRDWGGAPSSWGYASSPLVIGERAWLHVGGEEGVTVCFVHADGELFWSQAIGGGASHTNPVRRGDEVVVVTTGEVVGQALEDGSARWRHEWKTMGGNNSPEPLAIDDEHLFLSSAYRRDNGPSSRLLRIDPETRETSVVWENDAIVQHTTQAILHDGHLFGAGGRIDKKPVGIVCVEATTGERTWIHDEFNATVARAADGTLLLLTLDGLLVRIAADTSEYRELGRQRIFEDDKSYGPPIVLPSGRLVVRTEAGRLICLEGPGAGAGGHGNPQAGLEARVHEVWQMVAAAVDSDRLEDIDAALAGVRTLRDQIQGLVNFPPGPDWTEERIAAWSERTGYRRIQALLRDLHDRRALLMSQQD